MWVVGVGEDVAKGMGMDDGDDLLPYARGEESVAGELCIGFVFCHGNQYSTVMVDKGPEHVSWPHGATIYLVAVFHGEAEFLGRGVENCEKEVDA